MKERIIIDELIKDRNKLAKGVYTDEEIEKESFNPYSNGSSFFILNCFSYLF